ncbi:MAG: alpha-aminoadipate/glutamate carrier protein LysW/ArgW [Candidatus Bathyarchaeia archaeon]
MHFSYKRRVGAITFKAKCPECDVDIEVPDDALDGEIVSCPECGLDLEVRFDEKGVLCLETAEIEGEDWGE